MARNSQNRAQDVGILFERLFSSRNPRGQHHRRCDGHCQPHSFFHISSFLPLLLLSVGHKAKVVYLFDFYEKSVFTTLTPFFPLLELPRGYTLEKALISLYGPDEALRDCSYFHHYVSLDDIFA
jgi:hypothetical protein